MGDRGWMCRFGSKSLHVVKEWWPASYGVAGISVICRLCSGKKREASCLIGWKADGNSRKST